LSRLLLEAGGPELLALAVSSFQLESVVHFRPSVAVILNVDEEHLDRHRSLAEYVRIKSRVFMNQGHPSEGPSGPPAPRHVDDVLILPIDDERLRSLARKHRGRTLFFSTRQSVSRGAWLDGGRLYVNLTGVTEELGGVDREGTESTVQFPENVLVGALVCRLYGIDAGRIGEAVRELRSGGAIA
jgi:UDP-N-acetylmuramoylalanine--D-glutamate ligase